MIDDKIEVENINTPGRITRVNRAKYIEMRTAMLKVLSHDAPGISFAQAKAAILPLLCNQLFPQGATSSWWMKTVQLDLEAKGVLKRTTQSPMTIYRIDC